MGDVVEQTASLIPIAAASAIAVKTMEGISKPRRQSYRKRQRKSEPKEEWNEITQENIVYFIGDKKAHLVKENEGQIFTFGYDKFLYEGGKYYIA